MAPTSTAMAGTTDAPALFQTPTGIPTLPSAFDSPLATGQVHTPAVAIVTLVAVIICALVLLVALCCFIFLRIRGTCPQCPQYEDELSKWKNGSLKPITPAMVYSRPHNRDLEKALGVFEENVLNSFDEQVSPFDEQAKQFKARMHAKSLASLEGHDLERDQESGTAGDRSLRRLRNSQLRTVEAQHDSGWSSNFATIDEGEGAKDFEKEREQLKDQALRIGVPEPVAAHCPAPVSHDEEATIVVDPALREPNFNGTYAEYERDVLAERERQKKVQSFAGWVHIANDPNAPEAEAARMLAAASAKMAEMHSDEARTNETTIAPREAGQSRFQERFSLATQSYHGSI
ncbi:hypothetical protein E8E12_009186 [Didymella heteroderae]|uniref:Uncharacterized protein n=1 Tax=Didymella heteroderae TaxID=1769908 RepID=A0A9P4WU42_9PLEO|nr:hypothetical protein E8E12_009186 [Didymella heteroderae]